MDITKDVNQSILVKKWKFFCSRFFIYLAFFLVPYWIDKVVLLSFNYQLLLMITYLLFMWTQWFLLAKEVDYRLKVYVKAHSSMDRVLQRLFLGHSLFILYFYIVSFFPPDWSKYFFWSSFFILGIFYSWPTRGKIVTETMSQDFGEFKYLDGFEKTVLALIVLTFLVSYPKINTFNQLESLKLYLDNNQLLHDMIWSFLKITFLPFSGIAELSTIAWVSYFYFSGFGFFLLGSYCVFRYFFNRRLALLGVYSIVSTWSFSKLINLNMMGELISTVGLIWTWVGIWSLHGGTYRAGFFKGIIVFFATIWHRFFVFLYFIDIAVILNFFKNYTFWFRRQTLKYTLFGLAFILFALITDVDYSFQLSFLHSQLAMIQNLIVQKSFFLLAIFGLILFVLKLSIMKSNKGFLPFLRRKDLGIIFVHAIAILSLQYVAKGLDGHFYYLWLLSFLSLLPLEYIFNLITPFRSKRNFIFLVYILVCLLDSHFEGRVKIFIQNW